MKINKIFTNKEINDLELALNEYFDNEISKIKISENYEFSKKFKRKINRIFREQFNTDDVSHKKSDNIYEKVRSKLIKNIFLKFKKR